MCPVATNARVTPTATFACGPCKKAAPQPSPLQAGSANYALSLRTVRIPCELCPCEKATPTPANSASWRLTLGLHPCEKAAPQPSPLQATSANYALPLRNVPLRKGYPDTCELCPVATNAWAVPLREGRTPSFPASDQFSRAPIVLRRRLRFKSCMVLEQWAKLRKGFVAHSNMQASESRWKPYVGPCGALSRTAL